MIERPEYRYIDADNHFYEPVDRFFSYFDKKTIEKGFRIETIDNERRLFVGDKPMFSSPQMFLDHPMAPGSHLEVFTTGRFDHEVHDTHGSLPMETPEWTDRDARLKAMDAQNVEAGIFYGSLGLLPEDQLAEQGDNETFYNYLRGYNRYVEEEWGFDYQNRIFGAPLLALEDRDRAIEELEYVLSRGARVILITPRPNAQRQSPADPYFDPFWARVNEAKVTVVVHIGMSAYHYVGQGAAWGEDPTPSVVEWTRFQRFLAIQDRPIMDFLGNIIFRGLFQRHPNLRVLSVENSTSWLPYFMRKLEEEHDHPFSSLETFKQHVYHTTMSTDDIGEAIKLVGDDRIVLGSDFPHPEGPTEPDAFLKFLDGVEESSARKFLRGTNADLLSLTA
ncbi:amidohydrolase family protein [Pseudomaricurvus alkylphenolicus]|uniref:amidohydrolase family protein n=1 Tax=Pseudomaricurvus alkylphenolicus TaxID=1306991 RepID=UPI0014243CBF|nr:amidohydrolase family protein [Pseudomaricurvus alkylphenolicus]NIB40678.1 amidohydrolase family protein [Pseudomaricurvus alkylphenolicus]